MGHPDYRICRQCGKHSDEAGPLSWQRLCRRCGAENFVTNLDQLADGEGAFFDHWNRRVFMAARKRLLDSMRVDA